MKSGPNHTAYQRDSNFTCVESIVEVKQPGVVLHIGKKKKGVYSCKTPFQIGDYIIACEELLRDDDDDDDRRTFYLMNTNGFDGRNDGSDRRREINSSEIRMVPSYRTCSRVCKVRL